MRIENSSVKEAFDKNYVQRLDDGKTRPKAKNNYVGIVNFGEIGKSREIYSDKKLFLEVARYFDIRIVGLDFLINDISKSWKEQNCAILELNPVPCIEMHHLPTYGQPKNPAKALLDMTLKYYL